MDYKEEALLNPPETHTTITTEALRHCPGTLQYLKGQAMSDKRSVS